MTKAERAQILVKLTCVADDHASRSLYEQENPNHWIVGWLLQRISINGRATVEDVQECVSEYGKHIDRMNALNLCAEVAGLREEAAAQRGAQ